MCRTSRTSTLTDCAFNPRRLFCLHKSSSLLLMFFKKRKSKIPENSNICIKPFYWFSFACPITTAIGQKNSRFKNIWGWFKDTTGHCNKVEERSKWKNKSASKGYLYLWSMIIIVYWDKKRQHITHYSLLNNISDFKKGICG